MSATNLECPHGVNARFGCEKCARIERQMMAIPTVALMAATMFPSAGMSNSLSAGIGLGPDGIARCAWDLYEAVCKRCAE